jgi:hypothetical protein
MDKIAREIYPIIARNEGNTKQHKKMEWHSCKLLSLPRANSWQPLLEFSLVTRPTIHVNGGSGKMGRSVEWEVSTNQEIHVNPKRCILHPVAMRRYVEIDWLPPVYREYSVSLVLGEVMGVWQSSVICNEWLSRENVCHQMLQGSYSR